MLDATTRKEVLARGKPEPSDVMWWGEPNLGAWYTDEEIDAAVASIKESSHWTTGFGPNPRTITEFEEAFAEYCGARYAVAVNSCGTALDMAMICLELEPGDEVICPAINYKAAHMAIMGQGGKVSFCDIDEGTLNTDPVDVVRRITPRTRAIFPVHMNGLPAPMAELQEIAQSHPHPKHGPLKIVSDAARSCGATYRGRRIGSIGWITAFSFQTQKLMTTLGEGGMLTTDDPRVADRLRAIRQFGGEDGWGSNYKMTKVQAAVGLVQLKRLDEMNRRRREAARRRSTFLSGCPDLVLPTEPPGVDHLFYVYGMMVRPDWAGEKRDRILSVMRDRFGITCSVTNPPTFRRWSYLERNCTIPNLPVSESVGQRLFSAPLHPLFTEEQELYISAGLLEAVAIVGQGG
jgi:dTDP-4-amino-4,6-dideoxygalactose transaminase